MAGNPTTHSLPSVTVIVLNYNTRRHLQTCFESLQQTDYPPGKLQLMLVDNASHDDSLAFMAANFPDVTVVKNSRNLGFAGGNNAGARAARGELVAFLNPDMRVDPGWLAPLVSAVQGRPEVACAAAKILTWDGKHIDFGGSAMNLFGFGYQVGWGDPAPAHAEPREILAPCGGAMLIDRQVFLQAGGFDEDYFAYYEDTDLGWRLWVLGHKVMYVPQAVVYHIHHGAWGKEADEKRRVLYERNALYSIIKNYEDASLQKILPAALLLFIRRARLASDLNLAHFRTEPPSMAPHRFTEAVDIKRRPQDEVYDAAYYRRQAQKAVREAGWGQLLYKMAQELNRRRRALFQKLRGLWLKRAYLLVSVTGPANFISRQTMSYLIAANDLIAHYPALLNKRAKIQAARRRTDAELFRIFQRPFGIVSPKPHYAQTQHELAALFGLDKLADNVS